MSGRRSSSNMSRDAFVAKAPLPPLRPYQRCKCGSCRECKDNERWDRVFAKFEVKDSPSEWGRSPLSDL
jgi:hypothetical protein